MKTAKRHELLSKWQQKPQKRPEPLVSLTRMGFVVTQSMDFAQCPMLLAHELERFAKLGYCWESWVLAYIEGKEEVMRKEKTRKLQQHSTQYSLLFNIN